MFTADSYADATTSSDTNPRSYVSKETKAWTEKEEQWRAQKEVSMRLANQYRQDKLALQRERGAMERERVKVASFESRMRTAEILRKADPSLDWEEALRKAAVLIDQNTT